MTHDELKRLLRHWGRSFGPAPTSEWDEDSSGDLGGSTHVLLRVVRVGTRKDAVATKTRSFVGSDGALRTEKAPENICYGVQSRGGPKPITMSPDAEAVELAWFDLYRKEPIRALVLRMEYCGFRAPQKERAAWVGRAAETRITTRRYRHELDMAHVWMDGAMSGRRAAA